METQDTVDHLSSPEPQDDLSALAGLLDDEGNIIGDEDVRKERNESKEEDDKEGRRKVKKRRREEEGRRRR